jgi:hypothetical protein
LPDSKRRHFSVTPPLRRSRDCSVTPVKFEAEIVAEKDGGEVVM